ncbi:hypothetical protein DRQ12_01100 [candidate division KSB1 bacterium]|nr:MAG: hypothetical protein DRQ12_01100 [candidate division KSB1 bacterium]
MPLKNVFHFVFDTIFLFSISWGCAERQRANPLDPRNPETHGKPTGLQVCSDYKGVTLKWQRLNFEALVGYNIYRKSGYEKNFKKIAVVHPDSNTYFDRDIQYEVRYRYCISYQLKEYESSVSDEVSIVPGPSFIWVVFKNCGQVAKLTHDSSHRVFQVGGMGFPSIIAVDKIDNGVWVSDPYWRLIYRLDKEGTITKQISDVGWSVALAVDTIRNVLWVADAENHKIQRIDTNGIILQQITDFEYPSCLALDMRSGACWVTDSSLKKVTKLTSQGAVEQVVFLSAPPYAISVYQKDGSCWIADSCEVTQISAAGVVLQYLKGFNCATRISVDQETGSCWVLDFGTDGYDAKLVRLSPQGEKLFQVEGLAYPQSIAVDMTDQTCVVADTYNYRVVKISREGELVGEWNTNCTPWGVAIEQKRNINK